MAVKLLARMLLHLWMRSVSVKFISMGIKMKSSYIWQHTDRGVSSLFLILIQSYPYSKEQFVEIPSISGTSTVSPWNKKNEKKQGLDV